MLHQVARLQKLLRPRKQVKFHLCWKQYIKRAVCLCPKAFHFDNEFEFNRDVTKLLRKHNVVIRRTTTNYKHTNTAFAKAF